MSDMERSYTGVNDLKALFGPTAVESFRTARQKDRRHPLKRLFFPLDNDAKMVNNTDLALNWIFKLNPAWIRTKVRRLVTQNDFEAVSSFLGEARAYGLMMSVGLAPKPTSDRKSGPDFVVDDNIWIEVHSKQSEPGERFALEEHYRLPKAFHPNSPFGVPTSGDSVTTVAIQKVAQIKQNEELRKNQFSEMQPSILWLDFQDETWQLILGPEAAQPVNVWNDEYYSGPLWYGFYGWKGAPIFDGETKLRRPRRVVARMQHDGRFRNKTNIDAVVVSLSRHTFVFENPFSTKLVPPAVVEKLLQLPNINMSCCVVNGSAHDLIERIEIQQRELETLANEAVYGW